MADKIKNLTVRDDGCFVLQDVRLSYPHIFQKWSKKEGEKKKFSATFILDKTKHAEAIKYMGGVIGKMMTEAFGGRIPADKLCLRDGNPLEKEEYKGKWILKASEDTRPTVLNKDKSPITEDDDIIYAGCRVNVLFRPWVQKNEFGKRINANLLAVQFVADDEKFSGIDRPDAQEAFDEVDEGFDGAADADDEKDPFAD